MKGRILALVLACAQSPGFAADAPKPTDPSSIQGTWLAQTESKNGQKRNVTYQYVFSRDRLSFKDEEGKETKYSFKLETAGNLKFLVIQPAEAAADSKPVGVAYELKGDSLTIVIAPAGSRPSDISDRNDQELIVCKRKRP